MKFKHVTTLQLSLLKWYTKHKRDMPWRETRDPYKIWVSEIMLQQTQVDTVIPYYQRWIKKFPTLKSLANAHLSSVLKLWAGLGYYRRPRMMHASAKEMIINHAGKVPNSFETLVKLPGIGRYTAGAILSIAFNKPVAILDGNVKRILSRIFKIGAPIDTPSGEKVFWKISESIVHKKKPGDFNQALMELGATVCFPFNPQCGKCPVSKFCRAQKAKSELNYPVVQHKEKISRLKNAAFIYRNKGRVLVQKQPKEGRWGGLWMFPFWENRKTMHQAISLRPNEVHKRATIRHGFTKYLIDLEVFENKTNTITPAIHKTPNMRWLDISSLNKFAFPAPHQKIVKVITSDNA